ncbi:hypothetical protein [Candidatus Hodarchaeum mangrovi]
MNIEQKVLLVFSWFCILLSISILVSLIAANSQNIAVISFIRTMHGNTTGNFGENGRASFSFYGGGLSAWNDTAMVPVKYEYSFYDSTVNRSAYYWLAFVVEFINPEGEVIFNATRKIFTYQNTGYEFFDQFETDLNWYLPTEMSEISNGEVWHGIAYMIGKVTYDQLIYSNSSNFWDITYTTSNFSHSSVLTVLPIILALNTLIIFSRKKTSK